MRKLIVLVVLLLLNISLSFAAQIHALEFNNDNKALITINERDIIRFSVPYREYDLDKYAQGEINYELTEKEHKVMVREIGNTNNFVRLTIFIEGAETPQYFDLGFNNIIKLDFDRDSLDDLSLRLDKIEDKRVTFSFERINDEEKTGKVQLFGRIQSNKEQTSFIDKIKSFFNNLFKNSNNAVAEEEGAEETSTIENTNKPRIVDRLANNWIWTILGVIIILVLVWNRRFIKRKIRRLFW